VFHRRYVYPAVSILASFIHPGDDVRFPLTIEVTAAPTEIQVRNTKRITGRPEIFQADIGYAAQPRKDKRGDLFVLGRGVGPRLGISTIQLRCDTLRDYFYAGSRNCAFDRQPSFYELLRTVPSISDRTAPSPLDFAVLNSALQQVFPELATLERAFNIVGVRN